MAFLSNTLRNIIQGQTIEEALLDPTIPVVIPNDRTVQRYTSRHAFEELLHLSQKNPTIYSAWYLDLDIIKLNNTELFSHIIKTLLFIHKHSTFLTTVQARAGSHESLESKVSHSAL